MNSIEKDWDSMAAAYEEFNTAEDSYSYQIEWPCIQKLLPPLSGKAVLDIGCGTGIFTFLLEKEGVQKLVGLDLSSEMLKLAREKAGRLRSKAQFLLGDAGRLDEYVEGKFHLIFSSTTTHYIENLERMFSGIASRLTLGGCCMLSIIHPVYSALYPIERKGRFPDDSDWQVRYLDKRMRSYVQPWIEYNDRLENKLSVSYHHTMSDYLNAAVQSGLKLCRIEEPLPPDAWKTTAPQRYDSYLETPAYMILKFIKQSRTPMQAYGASS